ncbi:MAG: ATP-dependent Clp protease proteolytic subunit [Sutterella wadsworthensis]|nr:ATP-dependent Clp protease proteolytic subunit [Sutterella wadsworthensis]
MSSWGTVLQTVQQQNAFDTLRKDYLRKLVRHTHRNVLTYYSGWLQKPNMAGDFSIADSDKNGFMACMYPAKDRKQGLDLILHTPGGDVGATESLIDYLHTMYGDNIRTIVPQIAMSGGTLIAISGKEIIMGAHSSLGPVDPQFGGMAAQSYIAEFERACKEVSENPLTIPVWQMILGKLQPGFLTLCERAVEWSSEILENTLSINMLHDHHEKIESVKKLLVDQTESKNHARHINRDKAREAGLVITNLEDDQALQDLVLSFHHLMCITFQQTSCAKIIASTAYGSNAYITHATPAQ